jgi:hypothetical protein
MSNHPNTEKMEGVQDHKNSSGDSNFDGATQIEDAGPSANINPDDLRRNLNAKLSNPLAGYTHAELARQGEAYCQQHGITDEEDIRGELAVLPIGSKLRWEYLARAFRRDHAYSYISIPTWCYPRTKSH